MSDRVNGSVLQTFLVLLAMAAMIWGCGSNEVGFNSAEPQAVNPEDSSQDARGQGGPSGDAQRNSSENEPVPAGDDDLGGDDGASGDDDDDDAPTTDTDTGVTELGFTTLTQEFAAQRQANGSQELTITDNSISSDVTLAINRADRAVTDTQVTRPYLPDDNWEQNPGGNRVTENEMQLENNKLLDMVLVLDDSGSMQNEQDQLAEKISALFTDEFNELDWRIHLITTHPNYACDGTLFKRSDYLQADGSVNMATLRPAFEAAINAVGADARGKEMGILRAVASLTCDSPATWVRDNSVIAALIVSDEDNCSNGNDCADDAWRNPSYFTNQVIAMDRTPGTSAFVYGIYWRPQDPQNPDPANPDGPSCPTGYRKAHIYQDLVEATGGTEHSICEDDYGPVLNSISTDISVKLRDSFQLDTVPQFQDDPVKGPTVVVTYMGQDSDGNDVTITDNVDRANFDFDEDTIFFKNNYQPPAGAQVAISYWTGYQTQETRFELAAMPEKDQNDKHVLTVWVNDSEVTDANAYSVVQDADKYYVEFAAAPPPMAGIRARYKQHVEWTTEWTLGADVDTDTIAVTVAGATVNDYVFVPATGKLIIDDPPIAEAAEIAIAYDQFMGPVLTYDYASMGVNPTDWSAVDATTGDALEISWADNKVTFANAADVVEGRVVTISYNTDETLTSEIELPVMPILDSLVATAGDMECRLGSGLTLRDRKLSIKCDFPVDAVVNITFDYNMPVDTVFTVDGVSNPDAATWEVTIGGIPIAFTREGSTVTLTRPPPATATIKVTVKAPNS